MDCVLWFCIEKKAVHVMRGRCVFGLFSLRLQSVPSSQSKVRCLCQYRFSSVIRTVWIGIWLLTITASISASENTNALVLQNLSGNKCTSSATSLPFISTLPNNPYHSHFHCYLTRRIVMQIGVFRGENEDRMKRLFGNGQTRRRLN